MKRGLPSYYHDYICMFFLFAAFSNTTMSEKAMTILGFGIDTLNTLESSDEMNLKELKLNEEASVDRLYKVFANGPPAEVG